jgi:hypothetical protein
MGFFDAIKGVKAAVNPMASIGTSDFGRIDPNNQQAFWALQTEFGQAVMQGPAAQQQFFQKYGVRNQAHWQTIQLTLTTKWANAPGGAQAMSQAAYANSAAQTAQAMQNAMAAYAPIPQGDTAPVEGISLEHYA